MPDERLTPSFWLSEFLRSDLATRKGIDNTPPPAVLANIRGVLAPAMQRVRDLLGAPVFITSGYRSPELNAAIGGAKDSQHMQGLAADFIAPAAGTPFTVCLYLLQHGLGLHWDQLIWEGNWTHVSFVPSHPRGDLLTARFVGGRAIYERGIG
jgi:hypothetical protein